MKNSLLIFSLALSNLLFAQPVGSIVGTVLDKDLNNEPLPFANILIPEVNLGTTSDFDGLFALDGLAEGDYICLLYTSPSPRDLSTSRMPSSA